MGCNDLVDLKYLLQLDGWLLLCLVATLLQGIIPQFDGVHQGFFELLFHVLVVEVVTHFATQPRQIVIAYLAVRVVTAVVNGQNG